MAQAVVAGRRILLLYEVYVRMMPRAAARAAPLEP